jgi:hypothetical protein
MTSSKDGYGEQTNRHGFYMFTGHQIAVTKSPEEWRQILASGKLEVEAEANRYLESLSARVGVTTSTRLAVNSLGGSPST